MRSRSLIAAGIAVVLGLTLAGCSFLGGEEPKYTFWEPSLSPDGRFLVYESSTEENLELFILDLQSNTTEQITHNEFADWSPDWSPDGQRIVFASSRGENVDIFIIDRGSLAVSRLTTHAADDINPHWGVDGYIYFNSNRAESWEAYSIDPDTLELRKVTSLDVASP